MPDVERAHECLKNAMVLSVADGELDEAEQQYIERLRGKLGVEPGQFAKLVEDVKKNRQTVHVPKDRDLAQDTVRLLVEAAAADGQIGEIERDILHRLGDRVGLTAGDIDGMVRQFEPTPEEEAEIEAKVREIYAHFAEWDESTRKAKFRELADYDRLAVLPLLRMLESYRRPDHAENALEMKIHVVDALAELDDTRTAFYLAQQATFGDVDDEVSNSELRQACAHALGKLTNQDFDRSEEGVQEAARWWRSPDHRKYDKLVF